MPWSMFPPGSLTAPPFVRMAPHAAMNLGASHAQRTVYTEAPVAQQAPAPPAASAPKGGGAKKNQQNPAPAKSTPSSGRGRSSHFVGVSRAGALWTARCSLGRKDFFLGKYDTEEGAAEAVDIFRWHLRGSAKRLNFPANFAPGLAPPSINLTDGPDPAAVEEVARRLGEPWPPGEAGAAGEACTQEMLLGRFVGQFNKCLVRALGKAQASALAMGTLQQLVFDPVVAGKLCGLTDVVIEQMLHVDSGEYVGPELPPAAVPGPVGEGGRRRQRRPHRLSAEVPAWQGATPGGPVGELAYPWAPKGYPLDRPMPKARGRPRRFRARVVSPPSEEEFLDMLGLEPAPPGEVGDAGASGDAQGGGKEETGGGGGGADGDGGGETEEADPRPATLPRLRVRLENLDRYFHDRAERVVAPDTPVQETKRRRRRRVKSQGSDADSRGEEGADGDSDEGGEEGEDAWGPSGAEHARAAGGPRTYGAGRLARAARVPASPQSARAWAAQESSKLLEASSAAGVSASLANAVANGMEAANAADAGEGGDDAAAAAAASGGAAAVEVEGGGRSERVLRLMAADEDSSLSGWAKGAVEDAEVGAAECVRQAKRYEKEAQARADRVQWLGPQLHTSGDGEGPPRVHYGACVANGVVVRVLDHVVCAAPGDADDEVERGPRLAALSRDAVSAVVAAYRNGGDAEAALRAATSVWDRAAEAADAQKAKEVEVEDAAARAGVDTDLSDAEKEEEGENGEEEEEEGEDGENGAPKGAGTTSAPRNAGSRPSRKRPARAVQVKAEHASDGPVPGVGSDMLGAYGEGVLHVLRCATDTRLPDPGASGITRTARYEVPAATAAPASRGWGGGGRRRPRRSSPQASPRSQTGPAESAAVTASDAAAALAWLADAGGEGEDGSGGQGKEMEEEEEEEDPLLKALPAEEMTADGSLKARPCHLICASHTRFHPVNSQLSHDWRRDRASGGAGAAAQQRGTLSASARQLRANRHVRFYVAQVEALWEERDPALPAVRRPSARVVPLYWPEETDRGRSRDDGPDELFVATGTETVPLARVLSRCAVLGADSYRRVRAQFPSLAAVASQAGAAAAPKGARGRGRAVAPSSGTAGPPLPLFFASRRYVLSKSAVVPAEASAVDRTLYTSCSRALRDSAHPATLFPRVAALPPDVITRVIDGMAACGGPDQVREAAAQALAHARGARPPVLSRKPAAVDGIPLSPRATPSVAARRCYFCAVDVTYTPHLLMMDGPVAAEPHSRGGDGGDGGAAGDAQPAKRSRLAKELSTRPGYVAEGGPGDDEGVGRRRAAQAAVQRLADTSPLDATSEDGEGGAPAASTRKRGRTEAQEAGAAADGGSAGLGDGVTRAAVALDSIQGALARVCAQCVCAKRCDDKVDACTMPYAVPPPAASMLSEGEEEAKEEGEEEGEGGAPLVPEALLGLLCAQTGLGMPCFTLAEVDRAVGPAAAAGSSPPRQPLLRYAATVFRPSISGGVRVISSSAYDAATGTHAAGNAASSLVNMRAAHGTMAAAGLAPSSPAAVDAQSDPRLHVKVERGVGAQGEVDAARARSWAALELLRHLFGVSCAEDAPMETLEEAPAGPLRAGLLSARFTSPSSATLAQLKRLWTAQRVLRMLDIVAVHGPRWGAVAAALPGAFEPSACASQYAAGCEMAEGRAQVLAHCPARILHPDAAASADAEARALARTAEAQRWMAAAEATGLLQLLGGSGEGSGPLRELVRETSFAALPVEDQVLALIVCQVATIAGGGDNAGSGAAAFPPYDTSGAHGSMARADWEACWRQLADTERSEAARQRALVHDVALELVLTRMHGGDGALTTLRPRLLAATARDHPAVLGGHQDVEESGVLALALRQACGPEGMEPFVGLLSIALMLEAMCRAVRVAAAARP